VLAVSMVVQIGEELLVSGKLPLEPRALLLWQLLGHHGGPVAVNLAHSSRIPVLRSTDGPKGPPPGHEH
jgi:hypothetical protein